jgi:two-component system, NtrC family, response regulator
MPKPKLLIVDDDEGIRTQLKYALRDEYALSFAENRAEAVAQVREAPPMLVSLDLGLPPSPDTADEGMKALEEILALAPPIKVIVMTGNSDRQNALRAVELGAFDYHLKPIALDDYKVVLGRAAFLYALAQETIAARQAEEQANHFEEILGKTEAIRDIFNIVERVAKTDATALVEGESGTGKELVARAIHQRSARRAGPFLPINCGAIPETLLEAELFGHERGAFTGAHMQRKGKFEMADHGTLFLDEIGELPLTLQVKLLRFLQERTVERIGGRQPITVDTRVIAATNRDLKTQLDRGLFREDLYYRLSVIRIQVPPLRERGEDIALLANAFLRRAAQTHRRRVRFSGEALRALMAHRWPGNVRELDNRVSRAVIMARGHLIEPADLDLQAADLEPAGSLRQARERVEREALVDVLSRYRGNISKAARSLKVSRPTLHGLLDKHSIDAGTFR